MNTKLYSKLQEEVFQPVSEKDKAIEKYIISIITSQGAYKNEDGSWSCNGDIGIANMSLYKIPVKFKEVKGFFSCSGNYITNLEGCPEYVGEDFTADYCQLTSLEGGPKEVGGLYFCGYNKLTTLKGSPEVVGGHFNCAHNLLKTIEDGPKEVRGNYDCSSNQLRSLKGMPAGVKYIECKGNPVPKDRLMKTIGR